MRLQGLFPQDNDLMLAEGLKAMVLKAMDSPDYQAVSEANPGKK
jgi:hypothetical protein